jgi:uncharacterized protein HemX
MCMWENIQGMDIKSRQPRDSQPEVARSPKPLKGRKKGTGVTKRGMLLALVVLAFAGMAGYIVYQQIQLNEYRNNPTKAAQDEQARIVGLIRKHYKIPTYTKSVDGKDTTVEDAPEIASITDKTKLTGQAFF